jgi:hypothetical protein
MTRSDVSGSDNVGCHHSLATSHITVNWVDFTSTFIAYVLNALKTSFLSIFCFQRISFLIKIKYSRIFYPLRLFYHFSIAINMLWEKRAFYNKMFSVVRDYEVRDTFVGPSYSRRSRCHCNQFVFRLRDIRIIFACRKRVMFPPPASVDTAIYNWIDQCSVLSVWQTHLQRKAS